MTKKIRVGAVSYLNTKPLIYGFEQGMMNEDIELLIDYPANIATALLKDEIDIGLVPVAILPEMKEYHIIGDHCIGSEGAVASVCLFSDVPLHEIECVLMDYQSRTSVMLARVLMKEYWRISPAILNAGDDFRSAIKGTTAAIVIGDRALEQRKISAYHYDLSLAWKEFTGLPFVFAAWISNKLLNDEFIVKFNQVNDFSLEHVRDVIRSNPFSPFDLSDYYTKNISYTLTEGKKEGLKLFLKKIQALV